MILLFAACTPHPALVLEGDPTAGQALWQAECALCHGSEAEGTSRGPALQAPRNDRAATDTFDAIRFGGADMPRFELTDQQLADLLAWLRE